MEARPRPHPARGPARSCDPPATLLQAPAPPPRSASYGGEDPRTRAQLDEFQEIVERMGRMLPPSPPPSPAPDHDLKMLLDMEPSLVDVAPRVVGLPPPCAPSPAECAPTFKSVVPTSRTQMKLHLMREQLQEQERREARGQRPRPAPVSVPTPPPPPINVSAIPPQVLKVQTVLENPTRYHVIEKQKSQLRQYFSKSFQGRGEGEGEEPPVAAAASSAGATRPPLTAADAATTAPSPDTLLSPGLSSVATSTSDAEELLDDILSYEGSSLAAESLKLNDASLTMSSDLQAGTGSLYEQFINYNGGSVLKTSNSCPPNVPQIKPEPLILTDAEITALAKDRQKKDNHNMIERRRRFNINDRIKELGTLLPKNNDPYYEIVRDVRPNKGTILKSSVEYIKCLKHEVQRMKQAEIRQKQVEQQNRRLLLRIQELELQVKAHGIPVSEFTWQPTTPSTVINTYIKSNSVPSDAHKEMPDVVTEAATLTASQVEDLMEDDHPVNGDPMLSSLDVSSPASHRTTGHQSITEDDDDDSLAVDMDLVA
ncbi:microphthalmia-associated transcription factor isoform X2 [Ischnura elegans]|uniref:microphthalmia-associated transcription factor isoform X2 n=1 Tax=Ischnura elegans TaxID=197161 RepID=UPI001ED8B785|nr:microphthalmia-associated transcription factor isoform X2 [Ischnura elegans]